MASTTGIEIGPDSFLFVGVRAIRTEGAEVFAIRRFDSSQWPTDRRLLAHTHTDRIAGASAGGKAAPSTPRFEAAFLLGIAPDPGVPPRAIRCTGYGVVA